jgi:hypothetical protein
MAGTVEGDGEAFIRAATRTLDWAAGLLTEDDGFRGAEGEVDAYYFAPLAFSLGGRVREGGMVARYIEREFFRDGDVNDPADEGLRPAATFRNAWLCVGTHRLGEYGLSYPAADFLEGCQHPALGGVAVWRTDGPGEQIMDMGTTAAAVVAFLAAGRLEPARRAGDFLAGTLIKEQPEPDRRILLRTDGAGRWLTDFEEAEAGRHEIRVGEPGQVYWFLGNAMAALGQLYLASGEERYLKAGRTVFGCAEACAPGSFEDLTAAKVGWGASVLYAATRERDFAEAAARVGDMLVRTQLPEGVWLRRPAVSEAAGQPAGVLLGTSLERVCWLMEMARNLAG